MFSSRRLSFVVPGSGRSRASWTAARRARPALPSRPSGARLLEQVDDGPVRPAGLGREPGQAHAIVVAAERGGLVDFAGEEAPAKRTKGYEADPEVLAGRQDVGFGRTPPEGIFALDGRHRLDRMGAADRLRARLGQAEMLDLAGGDQVPDRARDVLDRHVRVDPMLIVEIDDLNPQPLQRAFNGLPDVFRATVEGAGAEVMAELRGDDDVLAERLQRFADEFLVRERAVDLGGVEEVTPRATASRMRATISLRSGAGPR